ncbi:MAG: LCCL domain-containing protein [Pseudomonadota bacterium]
MKSSLKSLFIIGAMITANPAYAELATPERPIIDWETTINHFQVDSDKFLGQRLSVSCPQHPGSETQPDLFGTDTYPSDSPICKAAQHAGMITESGGDVTLQVMPSPLSYESSERNEVSSGNRPKTDRAIAFVQPPAPGLESVRNEHIPRIDWDTKFTRTGLANRDLIGQSFTFECPAASQEMRSRRVVGTDRYAFDSMICRSAVHAGQIGLDGGSVTLRMEDGSKNLLGSTRHGIETQNGASVVRTIVFVND